jgi:hypothetical protein
LSAALPKIRQQLKMEKKLFSMLPKIQNLDWPGFASPLT